MSDQPTTSIDLYPICPEFLPEREITEGRYVVRFARDKEELDRILRMRFEVFNLEMGEGLDSSHETGRDMDEFDPLCHHLMVVDRETEEVLGSYRMQTAEMAARYRGFYSETEFDLSSLPRSVISQSMEVGRACVARSHRSTRALFYLWRGLALYVAANRRKYIFGCGSLASQDTAEGKALMDFFERQGHLHPRLRVEPLPGLECYQPGFTAPPEAQPELPLLLKTYLRHSAKVCGPPAVDRLFKTIDYFIVFDVDSMSEKDFRTYF